MSRRIRELEQHLAFLRSVVEALPVKVVRDGEGEHHCLKRYQVLAALEV